MRIKFTASRAEPGEELAIHVQFESAVPAGKIWVGVNNARDSWYLLVNNILWTLPARVEILINNAQRDETAETIDSSEMRQFVSRINGSRLTVSAAESGSL